MEISAVSTGINFGLRRAVGVAGALDSDQLKKTQTSRRMTSIDLAKRQPPRNTRAFGRAEVIRHLATKPWPDLDEEHEDRQHRRMPPYVINWSVLQIRGNSVFVMADPFRTYVQESRDYCVK